MASLAVLLGGVGTLPTNALIVCKSCVKDFIYVSFLRPPSHTSRMVLCLVQIATSCKGKQPLGVLGRACVLVFVSKPVVCMDEQQ